MNVCIHTIYIPFKVLLNTQSVRQIISDKWALLLVVCCCYEIEHLACRGQGYYGRYIIYKIISSSKNYNLSAFPVYGTNKI